MALGADRQKFIDCLSVMNTDGLRAKCIEMYDELSVLKAVEAENSGIHTEMAVQFNTMKKENEDLKKENSALKEQLSKEIEKNALKNKAIFGASTEGLLSLWEQMANPPVELEDEAQVETTEDRKNTSIVSGNRKHRRSSRRNARLIKSMQDLAQAFMFALDAEELDRIYGKGNWRITHWHAHKTLEVVPESYYMLTTYTPVISVGLEHSMMTVPYEHPLNYKGVVSESILAESLYMKFVLSLPVNRQEMDFQMHGLAITKQTLISWHNKFVPECLGQIHDYMLEVLKTYDYVMSDETPMKVNRIDGGAGFKCWMWLHRSSILLDEPPIVVFCYERSRATAHLRAIFGDFYGTMSCDAYISYKVLEGENENLMVAGCMMHLRRHFSAALFLTNKDGMSEAELLELPETQVLLKIRDIYHAERPLTDLSAEERKAERQKTILPLMDELYDYIHKLSESGEVYSNRMTDAINYAVNQETYVRRFLDDGNIPLDNGASERNIAAFARGRLNWLFADTEKGAEVNAIGYTIAETAKENGADVRIYFKYLLENSRFCPDEKDAAAYVEFMKRMMPWSDAYKDYEKHQKEDALRQFVELLDKPDPPRTPRKKDMCLSDASPEGPPLVDPPPWSPPPQYPAAENSPPPQ